ncbi:pectate lyase [Peristeroidobacter agariperforans]|uniref:pectate lyase n=1 Tax=Peristeroidobacter agariperforans TaxID=268404 RepID=UPI00101CF4DC|nr:pectate lyase [Peristeroidobacter agariperforans]
MKYGYALFALAAMALSTAVTAANRPSGYTTICNENQTCAVPASTNVAFGRADQFIYKVLSGSFVCSQATFGGRIGGGVNECSVPTGTTPTDPPPSTDPPTPDLGYYPGCAMPTYTETVQLTATHVVPAGTVFDGGNKRYNLSGGSQSEGQPAVFDVQEGATLRNVIIGPLAADGIHCLGNCTLERVWWEDIGEDAATALGPAGTVMNITCGAAYKGSDKTFQFNGRGEMRISNFFVANSGKLVRSCGDCTGNGGPRRIFVNNVITRDVATIVGINSNFGDVATIRNLTLNNSGTSKTKICQVYKGVVKGQGSTSALGVEFNTPNCQVSQGDVTLLPPSQMNTSACAGSCPIP